jgi:hypothetical protein
VYNGVGAQVIGAGNPSDVDIFIDNASGVTLGTSLTVNPNRTLTFTNGKLAVSDKVLTINGSVSGMSATNSFTGGSSSAIIVSGSSGGSAGTFFFNQTTPGTTNKLLSFTLNRTGASSAVTIGNALNIYGTAAAGSLTVSNGTLNTGGFITLVSDNGGTAQLGSVGGTISGNITVERYIGQVSYAAGQRNKLWRFLAPQVGGVTFANSWQQQIHITGPDGVDNGFDASNTNGSTIYSYNEPTTGISDNGWAPLAATTETMTPGVGYRVFVRGPRSEGSTLITNSTAPQNPVVLSAKGTVATGTQRLIGTCSNGCVFEQDGWNLQGNPYAASIDWESVSKTNVTSTYYVYNPGTASYATYNATTQSGTNNATKFISSGQSFFVLCTATPCTTRVEESHKSPTRGDLFNKTDQVQNQLRVKLTDASSTIEDEAVMLLFPGASKGQDVNYDSYKMGAGYGSISVYSSQSPKKFASSAYPMLGASEIDTYLLYVNTNPSATGSYILNFSQQSSFASQIGLRLKDKFLNTMVDLRVTPAYTFTTTSVAGSYAPDRFEVYMGNTPALPVTYLHFSAEKMVDAVRLTWATASESNNEKFILERSVDGSYYAEITSVKGHGNSSTVNEYSFNDLSPNLKLTNYYRLRQVDMSGHENLSGVVPVSFSADPAREMASSANNLLKAWPVPARDVLNLSVQNDYTGDVTIRVYDQVGKLVASRNATVTARNAEVKQDVSQLNAGIYFIEVSGQGNSFSEKVKFIRN